VRKNRKNIRPWPFGYLPAPLIPDRLRAFLARQLVSMLAIVLVTAAIAGLLSIISYDAMDPAWNVSSGHDPDIHNWIGTLGAGFADMTLQTIGYGVFGLLGVIGLSGWRLYRRKNHMFPLSIRIIALFTGVFALAAAFARVPASEDWGNHLYLGGAIGAYILNALVSPLGIGYNLTAAICFSGGVVLCTIAVGYPWQSWKTGFGRIARAISLIIYKIRAATGWINHYDALYESSYTQSRKAISTYPRRVKKIPSLSEEPAVKPLSISEPVVIKPQSTEKPLTQRMLDLKPQNDNAWEFPSLDLLQESPAQNTTERLDEQALQRNAMMLQQVLEDFSIQGEIVKIHPGPVVTLYELEPAPGIKSSRVIGLADDIARSMSAVSVRAAVVPGRNVIGIEIPNKKRSIVYMRDILASDDYQNTSCKLPLVLGKDIGGKPIIADLAKMPHLLVAGTTGSGKSVAVNTMLLSLLYQLPPEKCRFIMIDPKMLELSVYNDIPHLLSPVVTEPGKAVVALKWAVHEMEERYRAMSKIGVRNIDGYNQRIREAQAKGEILTRKVQTGFDHDTGRPVYEEQIIEFIELPYIVVIVDEFADLMLVAGKDVENAIQRLAQMARAAGIHIIMATQRPSVDVITGVIKANFPTRISFQVTSKIDSRTILGEGGAEQLLGMGDMLYMAGGGQIKRVHGPFVSDNEVSEVVDHLKLQGEPDYLETVTDGDDSGEGTSLFDGFGTGGEEGGAIDALYDRAVAIVAREGKASTSFIQRHLQIGYNRAARIVEEMEKQGVISPANHVGKREVLIDER